MPGPKTILSVLGQDPDLVASGPRLPRSTRTMWQILTRSGRIAHPPVRAHDRLDLPPPLTAWHRDVKDISTVPGAPAGKRQHVVETRNAIDMGTSILLQAEVRDDVTAETAVTAVAHLLQQQGLPQRLTIDRDPRFVGSHTGRDFPSPFIRFLTCVGGEVTGCPPHRPAKNAFGARYHRTYERECLTVSRPATLGQAREVTEPVVQHDTGERPNQARSCGNRPPRAAFPNLPKLPPVPQRVDPDQWVQAVHGRRSGRKVKHDGTVLVAEDRYSIKQALAGQDVARQVDATARAFVVYHRQQVIKQVAIKGLYGEPLAFAEDLAVMRQEARSQWRRWRRSGRDETTAA